MSTVAQSCLKKMYEKLDQTPAPLFRNSLLPLPPARRVLTPSQVEGIERVQELVSLICKARQQLNTAIVVYGLDLPPVDLIELSCLLMRADQLIQNSREEAKHLGVVPVLSDVRLKGMRHLLGMGTIRGGLRDEKHLLEQKSLKNGGVW